MVNIYGSGGGGITSDDVTASKADVLSTVNTITSDSQDEIVAGTLANIGSSEPCTQQKVIGANIHLGVSNGAHVTNAASGYPEVYIQLSSLRQLIGYTDASKVLVGTTIAGLTGTMANNGAVNKTLAINATYNIPAGYHNGSGVVKADKNYTSKAEFSHMPSVPTTTKTIQTKDVYMTGDITLKGDQNLKASNIRNGVKIFGITGQVVDYEAGMVRY